MHFTKGLVRHVLESCSQPGDIVLDPFAGFGTTLEVCAVTGRRGVGIELLADRAELARERAGVHGQVIHGDARQIRSFGLATVDLCFTSPPDMSAVDHPQNPTYLAWDEQPALLSGDYCLTFQR